MVTVQHSRGWQYLERIFAIQMLAKTTSMTHQFFHQRGILQQEERPQNSANPYVLQQE